METQDQSELKKSIKIWLKANNYSYAWLAERCYVSEATVRNWMAKKLIPAAKVHIIREMVKELPLVLPGRVQVEEETKITLSLDAATRAALEKRAFAQGKTLSEFLGITAGNYSPSSIHCLTHRNRGTMHDLLNAHQFMASTRRTGKDYFCIHIAVLRILLYSVFASLSTSFRKT